MSLKNNVDEQREYLQRNLEQINTIISAVIGYKTNLEINERKNCRGTYFGLIDRRNIRDKCGVMAKAFTEVTIGTFNVGWGDEGVYMSFDFNYQHIDGGTNGAEFCKIEIINDFVKIR